MTGDGMAKLLQRALLIRFVAASEVYGASMTQRGLPALLSISILGIATSGPRPQQSGKISFSVLVNSSGDVGAAAGAALIATRRGLRRQYSEKSVRAITEPVIPMKTALSNV